MREVEAVRAGARPYGLLTWPEPSVGMTDRIRARAAERLDRREALLASARLLAVSRGAKPRGARVRGGASQVVDLGGKGVCSVWALVSAGVSEGAFSAQWVVSLWGEQVSEVLRSDGGARRLSTRAKAAAA